MKKKIILLLIVMFLCGCEAKYNIRINEDQIDEEITIYEKTSILNNYDEEEKELFEDELAYWELDLDYYNKENFKDNKHTGYKYKSYFKHDEYEQLTGLNRCYEELSYTYEPTIKIETSNDFLCLNEYKEFNSFEIIIETDYNVLKSNADKQDGNKLIWQINKNNHTKKPIILELEKHQAKQKISINYILILIIFISLIVTYIALSKIDKNKK